MSAGKVPKARGSLILQIRDRILTRHGQGSLETVLELCSASAKRAVRGELDPAKFYPETIVGELVTASHQLVGADAFVEECRGLARSRISRLTKFFIRYLATPKHLAQNDHELWRRLHDSGSLTVVHNDDGLSHVVTIEGFEFPTREYELGYTEYHCGLLELTGVDNVRGVSERVEPGCHRQWYVWE